MKTTFKEFIIEDTLKESPRSRRPSMNYSFDEIDPEVDKNSFRDANKATRNRKRDDEHYQASMRRGENPTSAAEMRADDEWRAEQRSERQAMHGTEDEMEQKMPGMRERNRHFADQFDREVIQKGGQDALASQPGHKRHIQRKARDDRRFSGPEDEMEAKMPAIRDKIAGTDFQRRENDASNRSTPSSKRTGQRAERNLRRQYGRGNQSPNARGFGLGESNYPDDMSQYDSDPRSPNYDDGGWESWSEQRFSELAADISEIKKRDLIEENIVDIIVDQWEIGNEKSQMHIVNYISQMIEKEIESQIETEWSNGPEY